MGVGGTVGENVDAGDKGARGGNKAAIWWRREFGCKGSCSGDGFGLLEPCVSGCDEVGSEEGALDWDTGQTMGRRVCQSMAENSSGYKFTSFVASEC